MLLESYTKEIFRAECNPGFEALHCFAHLDQDVGKAIPYLNAVLGGFTYQKDPPSVTFKAQAKRVDVLFFCRTICKAYNSSWLVILTGYYI